MGVPSFFKLFNLLALTYFGVICVQSLAVENNWSDVEPQAAENEEFAKDVLEAMSTLSPNQCQLFKDMTIITYLAIKKDSGDLTTLSRRLQKKAYNFLRG
ncbi:hypothetical protein ACTXT7_003553 [Hymenolepis weldensis]